VNHAPDVDRFRDFFEDSPAWRHFDQRIVSVESGRSRLTMSLAPFRNVFGSAHGGVLAFLMDSSMAVAARAALGLDTLIYTIEFKVTFIAPAPPEPVFGDGALIRAGSRIAFTEARVTDAGGALLAMSVGTFGISSKAGT
jgi:uncharacterized protein (TIGR00369 family)